MTHDQLQAKCFQYTWNHYPNKRYLCWMNLNNIPSLRGAQLRKELTKLKAIGLVKGVADLSVVDNLGTFHAIEFKVGADKQSKQQIMHQNQLEQAGATYSIISDFETFTNKIRTFWGEPTITQGIDK